MISRITPLPVQTVALTNAKRVLFTEMITTWPSIQRRANLTLSFITHTPNATTPACGIPSPSFVSICRNFYL